MSVSDYLSSKQNPIIDNDDDSKITLNNYFDEIIKKLQINQKQLEQDASLILNVIRQQRQTVVDSFQKYIQDNIATSFKSMYIVLKKEHTYLMWFSPLARCNYILCECTNNVMYDFMRIFSTELFRSIGMSILYGNNADIKDIIDHSIEVEKKYLHINSFNVISFLQEMATKLQSNICIFQMDNKESNDCGCIKINGVGGVYRNKIYILNIIDEHKWIPLYELEQSKQTEKNE